MILVLNGLSKNSNLSLIEKKEIIEWYKNFFNEKKNIIDEAIEAEREEANYRESLNKNITK